MADFAEAYSFVAKWEGDLVNHPADPGGMTFAGISRKHHPTWPGWVAVDRVINAYAKSVWNDEIWSQTGEMVPQFYHREYWHSQRLDDVKHQGLALTMFDGAVNCGLSRSGKWLQQALVAWDRPVTVDGMVGPQTMATLTTLERNRPQDVPALIDGLLSQRGAHYITTNNPTFTRGWFRRLASLREVVS